MSGVPYTFASATSSIPLSQLDANFATPVTIGNTTVGLGNTTTSLGNVTLTNVTVSSGNVSVSSVTDSGLTSGRVTYATTAGLLTDSANMTFNGTSLTLANDLTVHGLTVGLGGGSISTNTALGTSALAANTTGVANLAVGEYALLNNQTGGQNIALGRYALEVITSISQNVAIGNNSLSSLTDAGSGQNTAVGHNSAQATTSGSYNVAVGTFALNSNTTASNNTAVGYQAGYAATSGYNTLIGYQAGYNSASNGNICIGYLSGYQITSGGNNVILGSYQGNSGGLDIRTSSNYIVLSDGAGNPRVYWDGNGSSNQTNANNVSNATYRSSNASFASIVVDIQADRNTTNTSFLALRYYNVGASQVKLQIEDSGSVNNRTGAYGTLSDAKLKENIVDATSKLDKVNQLKVRNYNLIGDDLKQIGFIAQEFEQVFPSMVSEIIDRDSEGNDLGTTTKSIKTSVLIPILVKAIQELKAEFDTYKATHP